MAHRLAVRMVDDGFSSPFVKYDRTQPSIVTRPGEMVVEDGHGFYCAAPAGAARLACRATREGLERRVLLMELEEQDILHRMNVESSGFNELRIRRGRVVRELDEDELRRLCLGEYLYDVVGFAGKVSTRCLGCDLSVEGTLPEIREAFALHDCEPA